MSNENNKGTITTGQSDLETRSQPNRQVYSAEPSLKNINNNTSQSTADKLNQPNNPERNNNNG